MSPQNYSSLSFGHYPRHCLLPMYVGLLPFHWNEGTDELFVVSFFRVLDFKNFHSIIENLLVFLLVSKCFTTFGYIYHGQ